LRLDTFSPAELNTYLAHRFPESPFPEAVAQILYQRTGGHPLFVVNLVDYLLAEGRLRRTESWWSITGAAKAWGKACRMISGR
jgi:predicted ATPase